MKNQIFEIEIHRMTGGIERLERTADSQSFNWTKGRFGIPYGLNFLDKIEQDANIIRQKFCYFTYLDVYVTRELTEEGLKEKYTFKNCGKKPIELEKGELGIYATFADSLDIEDTLVRRAKSHVWCGQNSSYIYNAKMDGGTDGVGLALLKGSIVSYEEEGANKYYRGDIILKLDKMTLEPQDSYDIEWLIFEYNTKAEFFKMLQKYGVLIPKINKYHLAKGEELIIQAKADTAIVAGKKYEFVDDEVKITIEHEGEQAIQLLYGDNQTTAYVYSGELPPNTSECFYKRNKDKNAIKAIYSAKENVELYEKVGDEGYLALATVDMFRYYNKHKGKKRVDIGIPVTAIQHSSELTDKFRTQVTNMLAFKGKYSPLMELAMVEMLLSAYSIWQEDVFFVSIERRLKRLKNWLGVQPHYNLYEKMYYNGKTCDIIEQIDAKPISGKSESLREYLIGE